MLSSSRLVTLTGAGGCGKTRLAIEVATKLAPNFADGSCFVDLAPIVDPALVDKAVAAGLGLSEQPGRALFDVLAAALNRRSVLLVMETWH